ncbi:MAG: RelA/SpoT family protein [Candidatus Kapaibacterium sp.]
MNDAFTSDELIKSSSDIYNERMAERARRIYNFARELNLDGDSLLTAFFAPADINDTDIRNFMKSKFGDELVGRLDMLNRISVISFPETKKQITRLRQLFVEITEDLSLIFIKLSERLIALKEAEEYDLADLPRISEECLYLYSPIAHRLGIRKIYQQMDDIAFKNLFPDEFKKLHRAVEKQRPQFEKKLADMRANISRILKQNNIECEIQSRVKRLYSIFLKIQNKSVSLDQIYDLMALRVITKKYEDCYIALGLTHRTWQPIDGRFRDWVSFPKPNGYRSIQTTVLSRSGDRFEVQIRTDEMHHEAEYGSAAHWAYKEGLSKADGWIMRLKEFLENDEYFDNPYELHEFLKADLKRDYIHVLTPMGDIKTLPRGATPVDFAFAVHTDLGYRITGARVNGKFAKLKTELHSGDIVEVIASKHPNPSRDWLEFVKTPKARTKIIIHIKKNEQAEIIAEGKRMWEKFKKRYRNRLKDIEEEKSFRQNLINVGFKDSDDFFSAVAIKSLKLKQPVLRKLYPAAFKSERDMKKTSADGARRHIPPQVRVEGMKDIKTRLAGCCHPIKGQQIVGYVTRHNEMKIHAAGCRYIRAGNFDEDRMLRAEWIEDTTLHDVSIRVFGYDYNDMLEAVVDLAGEKKITINAMKRHPARNHMIGLHLELEVRDLEHLLNFTDKLKLQPGIDTVKVV